MKINRLEAFSRSRAFMFSSILAALAAATTGFIAYNFDEHIRNYFGNSAATDALNNLFLAIGSALIGATAIAFSFIMFAMQVNIERMPFGLFKRLSSDRSLLIAFVLTFSIAIAIAGLSQIQDQSLASLKLLFSIWGTVILLVILLRSYSRALNLISPTKQISLLVSETSARLRNWSIVAERIAPILSREAGNTTSNHNIGKFGYFQLNSHWTDNALQSLSYCFSIANYYAAKGDHEIAATALNGVLQINQAYVRAKADTFFHQNYFIDNPHATDGFINSTLEHLRKYNNSAIRRTDEEQIRLCHSTLLKLSLLYSTIDYHDESANRTHAHLACSYLDAAVLDVVPHNMPDVVMSGARTLGESARNLIVRDDSLSSQSTVDKLMMLGLVGIAAEKYSVVTNVVLSELCKCMMNLIVYEPRDHNYSLKKIKEAIQSITTTYIQSSNPKSLSMINGPLDPYYSLAVADSFPNLLKQLLNSIDYSQKDDRIVQNHLIGISTWAKELHSSIKPLFILALEEKSNFIFTILQWVSDVFQLLIHLAVDKNCDESQQEKFEKEALWLISVLSFVPDEQEKIRQVEMHKLTEIFFSAAWNSRELGLVDLSDSVRELLISWVFKAGKYQSGWGTFERGLLGLVSLELQIHPPEKKLINDIEKNLKNAQIPNHVRLNTAQRLEQASHKMFSGRGYDDIDQRLAEQDANQIRSLLTTVIEKLAPEIYPKKKKNAPIDGLQKKQ